MLSPCPTGDGYYCIDETEYASFQGDAMLGLPISGRYVISGVIGRGAIGRVYKAHQLGVERDVVLKIFKLESLLDEDLGFQPGKTLIAAREDARDRFIREAKVLGQLTHPNCVTLYDFGVSEDGTLLYIAMEFVAGYSMRQAVQRGLKADAILEIMMQVLRALREAHAMDIVHRDLKPENIILSFRKESNEPVVKVLDFGIAKLVGKESNIDSARTTAGMLFGTPAYMSPEQCRGASAEVGPHSDIYAFGCMCYELATGQLPFMGVTPQQLLIMHQEHPVPRVHLRSGLELPQGMEAFIQKCLAKAPGERYRDAGRALKILEGLVDAWEPRGIPQDASELVDHAEIEALRSSSDRSYSSSVGHTPGPSQGAIQTVQGGDFDSLDGDDLFEQASNDAPRPSGAILQTVVAPATKASSNLPRVREENSRRASLIVGVAFFVVLLFCALLIFILYKML
ncbi:MAG: serine/threonine-protein kinase [Myxococcota bacterium]|nr:serine/threonine-protein kinase [Myxococcota bacterium]